MELPGFGREDNKGLESRLIQLIELMIRREIKEIVPEFDLAANFGYSIKVARDILKTKPGEEFAYLDVLADRGLLLKEHFDTVNLCPRCVSFTLKVNMECPFCNGLEIKKTELIHHFACGYVDLSEKFEKNGDIVCPKCLKRLRHIGVDYERPGETFKCEDCGRRFTRPKDFYYCLKCRHKFRMNEVTSKRINKYRLSPEAKVLLEQGIISSQVKLAALDPLTKVYREYVFRNVFLREAKRAVRYRTDTSVIKVEVENCQSVVKNLEWKVAL